MQLQRKRSLFDEARLRLILIGQATPRHAAHFRRMMGIDLPVLADEERVSYRAAGAKTATMDELLGPAVVAKGLIAIARHNVLQGRQVGDFAQLGGAMLISPNGDVMWAHMAEDASDNATPDEILAAAFAFRSGPRPSSPARESRGPRARSRERRRQERE